jgi:YHS domain-containing protein
MSHYLPLGGFQRIRLSLTCAQNPSPQYFEANHKIRTKQNNTMKKYILISTIGLLFNSCSEKEATVSEAPAETSTEMTAETGKPYPLEVCIVSGEELGSMGEAVSIVHEGQTIKFCCDRCVPKFKEDPAKYLSQLEEKPAE